MSQTMLHRARKTAFGGAKVSAPRTRAVTVCSVAPKPKQNVFGLAKLQPVLLASVMALNGGMLTFDALLPQAARAEEELTPYQKKKLEFQQRMELLKQARERALAGTATMEQQPEAESPAPAETAPAPAIIKPAPAPRPIPVPLPAPAPAPVKPAVVLKAEPPKAEEPAEKPWWEISTPAPAVKDTPAPAKPAPAKPAPAKVEAKVVKPTPAPAPVGKKRGPLPMWLAQILLLGVYGGVGAASTKYNAEASAVLKQVTAKVEELYGKAEEFVNAKTATK